MRCRQNANSRRKYVLLQKDTLSAREIQCPVEFRFPGVCVGTHEIAEELQGARIKIATAQAQESQFRNVEFKIDSHEVS